MPPYAHRIFSATDAIHGICYYKQALFTLGYVADSGFLLHCVCACILGISSGRYYKPLLSRYTNPSPSVYRYLTAVYVSYRR